MSKSGNLDRELDNYGRVACGVLAKPAARWTCFTAAGAGTLMGAADEVFADRIVRPINVSVSTGNIDVDIDDNGVTDFIVALDQDSSVFATYSRSRQAYGVVYGVSPMNGIAYVPGIGVEYDPAVRFTESQYVQPTSDFDRFGLLAYRFRSTSGSYGTNTYFFQEGNFLPPANGFFGVRFDISGETHFGFVEVTIEAIDDVFFGITVNSVGYEDIPDTAVHVPEPSAFASLGLLALGAAGVTAFRRRPSANSKTD